MTSGVRSGVSALRSWERAVLRQICKTALLRNLPRTKLCLRNLEHQKFSMKMEFCIVLSPYEAEIIKASLKSKFPLPWANTEAEPVQPYSFYSNREVRQSRSGSHTFLPAIHTEITSAHFSFCNISLVWFSRREVREKFHRVTHQTDQNQQWNYLATVISDTCENARENAKTL